MQLHSPIHKVGCRLLAPAACLATLFVGVTPALARGATSTEAVTGVTASTLSISIPSPAVVTGITPGGAVSGAGTVTVVSTLGAWTLGVADSSTAPTSGHLVASNTGCAGSEGALVNPLSVSASATVGTATSSGPVALSGTNQLLASGNGSATLTASYSQAVGATEPLLTGCQYSMTAIYTLQG